MKADIVKFRGRWAQEPEVQKRHRLLRALHELLDSPVYRVDAVTASDGSKSISISPPDVITDEARLFAQANKQDLHEAVLDLERERIKREDLEQREQKLARQWDALADPALAADDAKFDKFTDGLRQYEMAWDAPVADAVLEGAA